VEKVDNHPTRLGESWMPAESTVPFDAESTQRLLALARAGDSEALDRLLARCLPALRRWAHGRLPSFARGAEDTLDLVQEAVMKSLRHLDGFEPRHEGALLAYLRQAVANRIRDLVRQAVRRPMRTEMPKNLEMDGSSPLEAAIGAENAARYERALAKLRDDDREAIILRLELHYTYDELRVALDKPSEGAARVAVRRALQRLAGQMGESAAL
jgi:RNA polymerase sigma factor (sigma-70 family)